MDRQPPPSPPAARATATSRVAAFVGGCGAVAGTVAVVLFLAGSLVPGWLAALALAAPLGVLLAMVGVWAEARRARRAVRAALADEHAPRA